MNYIELSRFVSSVDKFNAMLGRKDNLWEGMKRQIPIIEEEIFELKQAVAAHDETELLDAVIDVIYTTSELLHMIEEKGYHINKALKEVANSNNSKFIDVEVVKGERLKQLILDSIEHIKETKGVMCEPVLNTEKGLVMLVDENGKIRKPLTFKEPYLAECLPSATKDVE